MSGLMILLPKLPITPLKHFQPLLFNLTSRQILHDPVINILPIEHVRRQGMLIVDHLERNVFIGLVVRCFIPFHFKQPAT